MTQRLTGPGPNPSGLCMCNCGQKTPIAKRSNGPMGVVIGKPLRYVKGHENIGRPSAAFKHGHTGTSEYHSWQAMLSRCYNPKNNRYRLYGAKGVTVCDRWNPSRDGSFENFLADMGAKPEPKRDYSIDRFPDPRGNYQPSNARWATRSQQMLNRLPFARPLRRPDVSTKTMVKLYVSQGMSMPQISRKFSISIPTIHRRLQKAGVKLRPRGINQFSVPVSSPIKGAGMLLRSKHATKKSKVA